MGGDAHVARVELEDGGVLLMPVLDTEPEQEVGLDELSIKFKDLLAKVKPVAVEARDQLAGLQADSLSLTVKIGLALESGKIVALLGGAKLETGLEFTFVWEQSPTK